MFDNVASGDADSSNLNPRQSGDLQLQLKFHAPPGKVITVMIVNTDKKGRPGKHWIVLWTRDQVCEVMDSYGLPLTIYGVNPGKSG